MARTIFITDSDKSKLDKLINIEKEFSTGNKEYLWELEQELERASILPPEQVPDDVITMYSQVVLKDLDYGDEMTYTLVYPDDADLTEDKISVLAPVGTAILGYRVGDIVDWKIPNGVVRLRVEKILYQPEATGNFDL